MTHFTTYSAEETPTETPSPSGGGGGGGISEISYFSVDKVTIKTSLKQGETKKEEITIKNTGTTKMKFTIANTAIQDLIKISESEFELNAGQSKTIGLDFIARADTIPDLYMGNLIITGGNTKKEILMAIEVESAKPLFDVEVEIPRTFLHILPGEELFANIRLYSLGKQGRVDVKLEYEIKDESGKRIIHDQETRAVETETNFMQSFEIPKDAKYGDYVLYIKATYDHQSASSSAFFSVGEIEMPFTKEGYTILIVVGIAIIVLTIILIELRKFRKYSNIHSKIDEEKLVKYKLVKK